MKLRSIYALAILCSGAAHLCVLGLFLGRDDTVPAKEAAPEEEAHVVAFNISKQSVAAAAERPVETVDAASVIETSAAEPAEIEGEVNDSSQQPAGELGPRVWTPPPPQPLEFAKRETEEPVTQAAIAPINLPEKGRDPVLISFGAVRVDDVSVRAEVERLGGSGALVLAVEVDDEGAPLGCSIVESSGSNILDTQGCEIVLGYRYDPARSGFGRPVYGRVLEALEWGEREILGSGRSPVSVASANGSAHH